MGIWHPTIRAFEVHGSRRESWDANNPSITVTLQVEAADVAAFIAYIYHERPEIVAQNTLNMPWCPRLRATRVEFIPSIAKYDDVGVGTAPSEYISQTTPQLLQVTYTAAPWVTSALSYQDINGSGSATYTQTVMTLESFRVVTEYLSQDFNLFCWDDENETPLLPDEAPGKRWRFLKIEKIIEPVFIDQILAPYILELNDKVNTVGITDNAPSLGGTGYTFGAEQVRFEIEDVQPLYAGYLHYNYDSYLSTLVDPTASAGVFYSIKVAFHCHLETDATWNKFWRMKRDADQAGEGWFGIKYKRDSNSGNVLPDAKPYEADDSWLVFWNV